MTKLVKKLKILVAPLDWGLGHTMRCVPVINELLKNNVEVILAGNEVQRTIFQSEFPECLILDLFGYNIKYSKKKHQLPFKILWQTPRILSTIKKENKWLTSIIKLHKIDGVISDNRYGLYNASVPSYFITHQLGIKTNMGYLADRMVQKLNYNRINQFDHCWIPDYEGTKNLGGDLSHPEKFPITPCTYLNTLSRFEPEQSVNEKNNLLFVISGPEPQRTIFEKKVLTQLEGYDEKATIIRGLPAGQKSLGVAKNTTVYNHLTIDKMKEEFRKASFVICRSGYSSVMDINNLKVKSIMVPTPGQTEQEYLGKYLMKVGFAICCSQSAFILSEVLKKATSFSYHGFVPYQPKNLSRAIKKFIQDCESRTSTTL